MTTQLKRREKKILFFYFVRKNLHMPSPHVNTHWVQTKIEKKNGFCTLYTIIAWGNNSYLAINNARFRLFHILFLFLFTDAECVACHWRFNEATTQNRTNTDDPIEQAKNAITTKAKIEELKDDNSEKCLQRVYIYRCFIIFYCCFVVFLHSSSKTVIWKNSIEKIQLDLEYMHHRYSPDWKKTRRIHLFFRC